MPTTSAFAVPVAVEAPSEPANRLGGRGDVSVSLSLGPTVLGAYDAPHWGGPSMAPRGMILSQLAVALPFADGLGLVWGFEVGGRFGVVPAAGETALAGIEVGVRAETHLAEGLDARFALRVAHIHDAPHAAWLGETGATLAGDPSFGLAHITTGGGALGVAWEVPGTDRRLVLSMEVEVLGRIYGHGLRPLPNLWLSLPIALAWRV